MTPTPSPFDSAIFGLRIGWAQGMCKDLSNNIQAPGYDLVFLRGPYPAPLHPRATICDVRLDLYARPITPARDNQILAAPVVRADPATCARAQDLAAEAFALHSRYFADVRLRDRAPEVYRAWIAAAQARGDLYVDASGAGFFSVSRDESALRLDLIAVAPSHRKARHGSALVRAFLELPDDKPRARRVKVEAGNVAAQNLYLRSGFSIAAAESVQHLWITNRS